MSNATSQIIRDDFVGTLTGMCSIPLALVSVIVRFLISVVGASKWGCLKPSPKGRFIVFLGCCAAISATSAEEIIVNQTVDKWWVNLTACNEIAIGPSGSAGGACAACAAARGQEVGESSQTSWNSGTCTLIFDSGEVFGPASVYGKGHCPDGFRYILDGLCTYSGHDATEPPTPGFDTGMPGDQCEGGYVGDPINPGSGNAFQTHTDYQSKTIFPIEFVRFYNSVREVEESDIGAHWRHSYSRSVSYEPDPYRDDVVSVMRPDGKRIVFRSQDGLVWTSPVGASVSLEYLADEQGQHAGWRYTDKDDSVELFDFSGKLLSIQSRAGLLTTVQRDAFGAISKVTGPYGRELNVSRDQYGRISSIQDPAGETISYSYNDSGELASVTYQDGSVRQYLYDEPGLVSTSSETSHLLTGIVDENAARWVTARYDAIGRATEVYEGTGANHYRITYPTSSTNAPVIVDPLGTSRTFYYEKVNGYAKIKSSYTGGNRAARGNCTYSKIKYDAHGFIAEGTSYNAYEAKTTFVRNDRGLELQRTEAKGWGEERNRSTTWHSDYKLPTRIEEPGRTADIAYYANGDVESVSTTDAATGKVRLTQFTYASPGLVKTIDGPRTDVADITTLTYNTAGNLAQIKNAEGHITKLSNYDEHGNLGKIVDPNGVVTNFFYDKRLRLRRTTKAGRIWEYGYDAFGNLSSVQGPGQYSAQFYYDAAHRLTRIEDAVGNAVVYTLNGLGQIEKEEYFSLNGSTSQVVETRFNSLGQLASHLGQSGQQTDFERDKAGNLKKSTQVYESGTLVTNYAVDALDRVFQITDPLSGAVTFNYDDLDQLISVKDAAGLTTSYQKNAFGDVLSVDSPDTGVISIDLAAGGVPVKVTDASGRIVELAFDALGRLAERQYPGHSKQNVSYHYDGVNLALGTPFAIGHLTGVTSPGGEDKLYYDAHGNLIEMWSDRGASIYDTKYEYNDLDKVTRITYPSGNVLVLSYDAEGRPVSAKLEVPGKTIPIINDMHYEPFGDWSQMAFASGLVVGRSFDTDGRIVSITTGTGFDREFNFDLRDLITGVMDQLSGDNIESYGYSKLGQLTNAEGDFGALVYAYAGSSGDRTTKTADGSRESYSYNPDTHQVSSVGDLIKTTGFIYDESGRVTSIHVQEPGLVISERHLAYNAQGRLVQYSGELASSEYTYDGFERRTRKITTGAVEEAASLAGIPSLPLGSARVEYGYTPDGRLLWEHEIGQVHIREYYWVGDQLVATYALPNASDATVPQLYVYVTDQRGAPYQMVDTNNDIAWEATYLPFGKAEVSTEGVVNNVRLPGQYYDAESGLHYNWHRYYDPSLGRYLQSDPIGLLGGLNTYAYVSGNPINFFDPFGLKEYPDNFAGPLPPDGYYSSEMTQTKCGKVPPGPPGADINSNMQFADDKWDPFWFYDQIRNNSPWDYKQQGRKYEDFGNFNFGATGSAFGLPQNILQRGAGWANQKADPTRKNLGSPWGGYPYGDDPNDQEQIEKGSSYCECMGY